jgi:hypothetical protein
MPRARHLIPLVAAGAFGSFLAWPAGAVRATELPTITTTNDGWTERVDWRDDDSWRRHRYRYRYRYDDDHHPYRYGYRYHPFGYYGGFYPYAYDYYRPRRGFGFYGPGFVFEFGRGRRWRNDD